MLGRFYRLLDRAAESLAEFRQQSSLKKSHQTASASAARDGWVAASQRVSQSHSAKQNRLSSLQRFAAAARTMVIASPSSPVR